MGESGNPGALIPHRHGFKSHSRYPPAWRNGSRGRLKIGYRKVWGFKSLCGYVEKERNNDAWSI